MKKNLTLMALTLGTLLLTGCGTSENTKDIQVSTSSVNYTIEATGNNPIDNIEYEDKKVSVKTYTTKDQVQTKELTKRYKALTGEELVVKDASYVIAKAGIKNDSSYEIQVQKVEDKEAFTKVTLAVIHSTGACLSVPTISVPYSVVSISNTHKEIKYEVINSEINCK